MKQLIVSVIFMITLFSNAHAAEKFPGTVKGKVLDAQTNEPLEFVTISITKKGADNYQPKGAITNQEGIFTVENLSVDTFILKASMIGYVAYETAIVVTNENNVVDIPPILLSKDVVGIEEVQVKGLRSQMKFELDKKVFNVAQNIASTGGAASDVLRNIPSVKVGNKGEVSLRGNSSVTIWIDGKASGLSSQNRGQILRQLPAESIEKIEITTNPSAKYSPEGTAGIINIILKKNRKAGYYGGVQAGADSHGGYSASTNFNFSSSKLDVFANLGFNRWVFKSGGYSNRQNYSGTDTTYLNQKSAGKGTWNSWFARTGLTWHVTTKDHLSLSGMTMIDRGTDNNTIDYRSNITDFYSQSNRISSMKNNMFGGNLQLGYKHEFSDNSNIDFSASYNRWKMKQPAVYKQTSLFADNKEMSTYQKQKSDMGNHNWEFQADYVNTINEKHKIEAGYKGTVDKNVSPVETYSGSNENNFHPVTSLFNRFSYNQDVHAIYGTYGGRLGRFSYQAGVRGEYSNIVTRSLAYMQAEQDVVPYKTHYFNLFPSTFLSYSLPNDNEVQLNYSRRISRPWEEQLNPFMNITDSTNISFGNPFLKPEYSNSFELNYIKNWDNHMFSFSGYFRTTENVIQNISYMENNIMKTTYENITKSTSTGTELVLKDRFFKKIDLTTSVNLFYYKLDGFSYLPKGAVSPVTGKMQDNFTWNVQTIANIALPKSYTLQLNGDYNARQLVAQGHEKASYSLDAGLRKSFDKFSISFSAEDLFNSRKWSTVTNGADFKQVSKSWWGGRQFGATLTYNFGDNMSSHNHEREDESDFSNQGKGQPNRMRMNR
nr:TonB-dependent receptor [uncultured Draconibacterium sp.]